MKLKKFLKKFCIKDGSLVTIVNYENGESIETNLPPTLVLTKYHNAYTDPTMVDILSMDVKSIYADIGGRLVIRVKKADPKENIPEENDKAEKALHTSAKVKGTVVKKKKKNKFKKKDKEKQNTEKSETAK